MFAYHQRWAEAEVEFATALKLDPNNADAWAMRSELMVLNGRAGDAIDCIHKALRLNPHSPGWYHWFLGQHSTWTINTSRRQRAYATTRLTALCLAAPWPLLWRNLGSWKKRTVKPSCSSPAVRISRFMPGLKQRRSGTKQRGSILLMGIAKLVSQSEVGQWLFRRWPSRDSQPALSAFGTSETLPGLLSRVCFRALHRHARHRTGQPSLTQAEVLAEGS